ncbi:hypothetical protein EVG20_g7585 [Dentipellis fragilis]|uniref:DUF6697 domain-containing protein n=1 Tax=Dentipellis fragilis TaxID=205917 RepID=A0A4Y9YDA7_9AGAM|nr:hypothetical protein EVG20_g7585 [Dentipellis fragilis]
MEHSESPTKDSAAPSKRQKVFGDFEPGNAPPETGGSDHTHIVTHTPVPEAGSPHQAHVSEDIISPDATVIRTPSSSRENAVEASPSHTPLPRRWMRTRLPAKSAVTCMLTTNQFYKRTRRKSKGKGKAKQHPSEQVISGDEAASTSSSRAPGRAHNDTSHTISNSLKERVAHLTPFTVNSAASPLAVSHAFLTRAYGVSGMTMLVKIAPEKNVPRRAQRPMIFPRSDNNPSLPTSPVWVKVTPAKENVWRYLGDYELKRSASPLTAAEARQFPTETVKAWAKTLGARKHDAYAEIRMRIWLRKNNEAVTENAVQRQMGLLKDKNSKIELSQSEIYNALCSGDEKLHVLTLHCIGYEHKFMADVEEKWRSFVPRAKGSRT